METIKHFRRWGLFLLLTLMASVTAKADYEIVDLDAGQTKTFYSNYINGHTVLSYKWTAGNSNITITSKSVSSCTIKTVVGSSSTTSSLKFEAEQIDPYYYQRYNVSYTWLINIKAGTIIVTNVTVSPTSASLKVGETKQLSKTITPSNATNQSVTWKTSSSSVATVSNSGLVTAIAAGDATITCTANDGSGKYGTCAVKVNAAAPIPVTNISLNYSTLSLVKEETRQLRATVSPSNATDKTVKWTSSNSSIASVSSDGLVTAVGRGTATITCKANDGSGVQATCDVTVSSVKPWSTFTVKTTEGVEMKFYSRNDGTCYVYGSSSSPAVSVNTTGPITIPSEAEGLKVTSISSSSFYNCKGITKVTIPNTVETIGGSAFSGCTALESVAFGNGLKKLEYSTFYNCTSLTSVTVPNTVETIGGSAFYGCTALESVAFGNGLKKLEYSAFYNCTSLTSVTGINQLEYIGSRAFYNTPWYDSLPDGLLYLGKVLYKYKGTMPEGTKVGIKDGTTQIGYECFYNCTGLIGVTIPQTLTTIDSYAFEGCTNLSSISVASGNPKYDSRNNCNAIVETATNTMIAGCKTTTFPNTVKAIGSSAFYYSGLTEVVIPNTIDSIADYAFAYSRLLTSIAIGKGVTKIKGQPFRGCLALNSISVASGNPSYDSRDNCNAIIEKGTGKLIVGCPNTVIPTSVKAIGQYAFYNYSNVFSLSLIDVEKVESYAFGWIYSLRSLTLGKKIKELEKSAFYGCASLRTVRCMADEPIEIDESVFSYDSNNPDSIYNSATLYVPIGSKINYMTSTGWNKFKKIVEIADDETPVGTVFTVNTIEGIPLSYIITDTKLKTCELIGSPSDISGKVTIPAQPNGYNLKSIGNSVFYTYNDNRQITEVVIPEGVMSIGNSAFESRHKTLSKVSLPNSLTTIGNYAFLYCTMESFVIPQNVTNIGSGVFGYCENLNAITVDKANTVYVSPDGSNTVIEKSTNTLIAGCKTSKIPETVLAIGRSAFYGCGFTSVTIPGNVKAIEPHAFYSCRNLTEITSLITEPFDVDSLAFSNWNADEQKYYFTDATLYVPIGTKAKYQSAGGWKYFSNIVEITAPTPTIKGDVNEDEKVNGTDLVALTNIILGKNPEKPSADVNGDGKVNGTDYVALANIILGKASARQMTIDAEETIGSTSVLRIEPFSIKAGETKEITVSLTNPYDELTLLQFDLNLPEGLTINKVGEEYEIGIGSRTSWKSHQLVAYDSNNTIRCLLASNSNAPIEGTDGAVVRLAVTASNDFAGGTMTLHDILGVTPTEHEMWMTGSHYVLTTDGTTGIFSMGKDSKKSAVYNLSGQRHATMKKGVNIVDGKKVIKK